MSISKEKLEELGFKNIEAYEHAVSLGLEEAELNQYKYNLKKREVAAVKNIKYWKEFDKEYVKAVKLAETMELTELRGKVKMVKTRELERLIKVAKSKEAES